MLACTTEKLHGRENRFGKSLPVNIIGSGCRRAVHLVPYILANAFVNVEFTLQAVLRQDYAIVYAIPSLIRVICY